MASVELTVAARGALVIVTLGVSTLIVAVAVCVAGLLLVEVTEAVLLRVPLKPAAVVPLTTNVTAAPAARVPRLSLTVWVPLLRVAWGVPSGPVVVTPVQVTPAGVGRMSARLTA